MSKIGTPHCGQHLTRHEEYPHSFAMLKKTSSKATLFLCLLSFRIASLNGSENPDCNVPNQPVIRILAALRSAKVTKRGTITALPSRVLVDTKRFNQIRSMKRPGIRFHVANTPLTVMFKSGFVCFTL